METDDIKKIWKTLAEKNIVEEHIARENINQIIAKKGNGILNKMRVRLQKEIRTDIGVLLFLCILTIGVTIYQKSLGVEKMAYPVLLIIMLFFGLKLYRSIRKRNLVDLSNLTGSVQESTISNYLVLKKQLRQDYIGASLFAFGLNLWVAYVYWQTFGHINLSEFTFSVQYLGFIIMILVFTCIILVPLILRIFYKKKYKAVLDNFEATLDELKNED